MMNKDISLPMPSVGKLMASGGQEDEGLHFKNQSKTFQ